MTTISLHHASFSETARHATMAANRWVGQVFPKGWMTLEVWYKRSVQRRVLRELDARLLQDIGISRSDAWCEGRKRFWEA